MGVSALLSKDQVREAAITILNILTISRCIQGIIVVSRIVISFIKNSIIVLPLTLIITNNIMIWMAIIIFTIIFIQVVVIAVITGLASLAIGFVLGFFLRYYFVIIGVHIYGLSSIVVL